MSDIRDDAQVSDAPPMRLERRRPGRIENLNPALIPLLRGEAKPPSDTEAVQEGDLAPATGIAVSVVLSGLAWVVIGCILYWR